MPVSDEPTSKPKRNRKGDPIRKSLHYLNELGLTTKQIMFVYNYCENGFNGSKAYRDAYSAPGKEQVTEQSAGSLSCLLLKDLKIQAAIKQYLDTVLGASKSTLEKQIFDTLFKRAFYDISMFMDLDGEVKTIDDPVTGEARAITFADIPAEWRCVIDGIERKYYGKDSNVYSIVLKLADRQAALNKLDNYIQMTKETKVIELADIPVDRKRELASIFDGKLK